MARARTALNILQQVGASIGTTVLPVLLASELTSQLGGHGTIGSPPTSRPLRAHIAPPMATAFGNTFWWALGMLVIAFLGSLAPALATARGRPGSWTRPPSPTINAVYGRGSPGPAPPVESRGRRYRVCH